MPIVFRAMTIVIKRLTAVISELLILNDNIGCIMNAKRLVF